MFFKETEENNVSYLKPIFSDFEKEYLLNEIDMIKKMEESTLYLIILKQIVYQYTLITFILALVQVYYQMYYGSYLRQE